MAVNIMTIKFLYLFYVKLKELCILKKVKLGNLQYECLKYKGNR